MRSERLAYETIRWMTCHVVADCLELVATPPEGFMGIPVAKHARFLRLLAINKLPWADPDMLYTNETLEQAKLIISNHRSLISGFSKVTVQHQQKSEKFLAENLRFVHALDIISGWEIAQPRAMGYIELGFLSEQTAREALLVIFSTPRYQVSAKVRLGLIDKMGNYTSPF